MVVTYCAQPCRKSLFRPNQEVETVDFSLTVAALHWFRLLVSSSGSSDSHLPLPLLLLWTELCPPVIISRSSEWCGSRRCPLTASRCRLLKPEVEEGRENHRLLPLLDFRCLTNMDHRGRPRPDSGHPDYSTRDQEDYYWYYHHQQHQQWDRESRDHRGRHWAHHGRPDQYPYHMQQYQYPLEHQRPQSRCVEPWDSWMVHIFQYITSEVMKVNKGKIKQCFCRFGSLIRFGQIRMNYLRHLLLSTAIQQMC